MRLSTFAARARVERGQEYLRPAAACAVLAALGAIASTNPGTDSGQRAQDQKQQRPSLQRCGTCEVNPSTRVTTWAVNPITRVTTIAERKDAHVRTHPVCVRARRSACVPEARTAWGT